MAGDGQNSAEFCPTGHPDGTTPVPSPSLKNFIPDSPDWTSFLHLMEKSKLLAKARPSSSEILWCSACRLHPQNFEVGVYNIVVFNSLAGIY